MTGRKDKQQQDDVDQPQEAGAEQVQEAKDAEDERGYLGAQADETPNEHYTVQGVTAGKPVPEVTKYEQKQD